MKVARGAAADLFEQDMHDSECDVSEEVESAFVKGCEVSGNDGRMPVLKGVSKRRVNSFGTVSTRGYGRCGCRNADLKSRDRLCEFLNGAGGFL